MTFLEISQKGAKKKTTTKKQKNFESFSYIKVEGEVAI